LAVEVLAMLKIIFVISLLVLNSCGEPVSGGSESRLMSTNTDSSEQPGFSSQGGNSELELLPYGYDGFESQYIFPSSVELNGTRYLVDILKLKSKLLVVANQARRDSEAVCFEGCALYTNLYLLSKMKALYSLDELKSFQRIKPCFKNSDDKVVCHSGPTSYTKKGSADFCLDLINRLSSKGADILSEDGKSIDPEKVVSALEE